MHNSKQGRHHGHPTNDITSHPQKVGDVINEQMQNSNAPLWAGLRAYRAQKEGKDEK